MNTQTRSGAEAAAAARGEVLLEIDELHSRVEGREILRGISLTVHRGEIHAVMGPNGSGKSTLAHVLMGRPGYEVTGGRVRYKGEDLLSLTPDERARAGLFLAFQYPQAIPGVSVVNFLRAARNAVKGEMKPLEFHRFLREKLGLLDMDETLVRRYVNDGFSGGEKKRNEVLQMAVLEPEMAILDETDSGLDIDALKAVAEGIRRVAGDEVGVLLITHYQRILDYLTPDHVHVLVDGQIVRSGGQELAAELERSGYDAFREEAGATPPDDRGPLP